MRRRAALGLLGALGTTWAFTSACRKQEPPPVLGPVAPFELVDRRGRRFDSRSLLGAPWLGSFFFTTCPTVCPRMMRFLKAQMAAAKQRGLALRVVAITVDPINDTPAVLARHAAELGVDERWTFLTGDAEKIHALSENSFKLAVDVSEDRTGEHAGISHGSHVVLVDGQSRIRGYFRSSEDSEGPRLLDAAAAL